MSHRVDFGAAYNIRLTNCESKCVYTHPATSNHRRTFDTKIRHPLAILPRSRHHGKPLSLSLLRSFSHRGRSLKYLIPFPACPRFIFFFFSRHHHHRLIRRSMISQGSRASPGTRARRFDALTLYNDLLGQESRGHCEREHGRVEDFSNVKRPRVCVCVYVAFDIRSSIDDDDYGNRRSRDSIRACVIIKCRWYGCSYGAINHTVRCCCNFQIYIRKVETRRRECNIPI